ncbi:AMP-binding protein [Salinarimonas soli]|uniref:Long-chain fatty acid--CoA ligase n=1 Tax=Salinarimonas soli TaxID=1638099 RepID=A0A5B2VEB9_9HYPH|nr:AMP-binding protein [Salinarimonas soli]KAA2236976.1 long-chain fatty acid--CoA ligase [Salinarimonas soli]
MNATAAMKPPVDKGHDDAPDLAWEAMRLSGLVSAATLRHPERLALLDQPGREDWSGRPRIAWTYSTADEIRRRLAAFFAGLGLAPGAVVGLCLPGGSEACLSLLAVEEAGLTPCLLPAGWSDDELAAGLEAANVQAVVTQGVIGEQRPAETFCRLASRYFGLRFLCAFGPLVPDGVIDLDRVILGSGDAPSSRPVPLADGRETGLVTFSRRAGAGHPVFRPFRSTVAAAVTVLVAAKIEAGERILSLLAPDDHRGITTGLIASFLSGAALEHHGLFDGRMLMDALAQPSHPMPTHLVAPGWMEPHIAKAGLPPSVRSVILVHDAPVRFRAKTPLARRVVDILSLDELALVARARRGDQFALTLADDPAGANAPTRHLMRVRTDADGAIQVAGLACDIRSFERGQSGPATPPGEWRSSGFKAEVFAGIVIGVG